VYSAFGVVGSEERHGCVFGVILQRDETKTDPFSAAVFGTDISFLLLCRHTASPSITLGTPTGWVQ